MLPLVNFLYIPLLSIQTIQMSAASPAWRLYTAQMDAVVLLALKKSILTSLDAMYLITSNINDNQDYDPILTIRLELVEQTVSFSPPMDRSSSVNNVDDAVESWLSKYVKRADLVRRLTVSYLKVMNSAEASLQIFLGSFKFI